MAPVVLHVAPHPDDEALGCPAALLHLHDRGWTVVSVFAGLGREAHRARRRAEAEAASARAGFTPVFMDPPLRLDLDADLAAATARVAAELPALVAAHDAAIVVSPSPHDLHHGHEAVGRGVQRALAGIDGAGLHDAVRWWMWGLWCDLPAPNVFYGFDEPILARALEILTAYEGELTRNDYRRLLAGRAAATAVTGAERVFGFGAAAATALPYAEVLTEVRMLDGRFMASPPHHLDQGPEPTGRYAMDLTAWIEARSVRELVGHVTEVPDGP